MTDHRITPVMDLPEPRCLDCGEPARWPFGFCGACLESRFGKAQEHLDDLRMADTHSSDVDPGDYE